MTLAERIRDARKAAGITSQKKLADKVGVTERTVKRWEAGKNLPDEQNRRDLARVLGGSADEWLGVRGVARPALTPNGRPDAVQAEAADLVRELRLLLPELHALVEARRGEDAAPQPEEAEG